MHRKKIIWLLPLLITAALLYLIGLISVHINQRSMIFLPTRGVVNTTELTPWMQGKNLIGYCREVEGAQQVWFMLHGNAGQAAHRSYVLPHIPEGDSFYVLEYPGYGKRPGAPSKETFNVAAAEGYEALLEAHPGAKMVVMAESIGSGPACSLATLDKAPERFVLFTPFDTMINLASHHARWFPASLIIKDDWDNIEALAGYKGQLEVYGALQDSIIPMEQAKRLADSVKGAKFIELNCGHNDWAKMDGIELK